MTLTTADRPHGEPEQTVLEGLDFLSKRPGIDRQRVAEIQGMLLDELVPGWELDPHMIDTPNRVAKFWGEFLDYDPGKVATTFPVSKVDQMVAVTGIETWSLCAHHLLPFSATVAVGYLAEDRVLGLSKFARLAHASAHRPTSQEQLVETLADLIEEATGTANVAVTASGLHLCMAMRGVRTPAKMTTSVLRGRFRDETATREEWLNLTNTARAAVL